MISAYPEKLVKLVLILVELILIGIPVGFVLSYVNAEEGTVGKLAYLPPAVIFFIIFLIFNCCLFCFKDDLDIAIAVIDTSADFYNDTKRLMFVSVFYGVVFLIVSLASAWSMLMIYSMNTYVKMTAEQKIEMNAQPDG